MFEESTKKKKRKLNSSKVKSNHTKRHRGESSKKDSKGAEEGESWAGRELDLNPCEERPWRNLQLILSLQNKQIDLQKKFELAFDFVNSREIEGRYDVDDDHETVNISRLIVFLNDWIQSLLVSPEKKVKVDGIVEASLDSRCWRIFEFCLKESLRLHFSLSFSRNMLRAIGYIARNVLSSVSDQSVSSNESFVVGEGSELYGVVLNCFSLLFSIQNGLSNENLELWVSTIVVVIQLVQKIYAEDLNGGSIGAFALQFSCVVLEPFARFLRIHPTRKNGFRDFVDKLLEPLLLLVGVLHRQINTDNSGWEKNLLKLVEEVLFQGLFHPVHIDGFLGLRSVEKYAGTVDGKAKDSKVVIKSYHRHLFDKLENIIKLKNGIVLSNIGKLFHLFVVRVKKQKGASGMDNTRNIGSSRHLEDGLSGKMGIDSSQSRSAFLDNDYISNNLSAEARKLLFDFFVQLLEPLLHEMNVYVQPNPATRPSLLDVHCTLKSINSLLASFLHEKLYVRTEDISEGACLNFLKKVYDTVVSFATKLVCMSEYDIHTTMGREMFPLLAKELFFAIGCFLDIEYDVIGNDLISLWHMMLSYMTIGLSLDSPDHCLLTSSILHLGCQMVNLFSALRQVNNSIFTLCKAVRLLKSHQYGGELSCTGLFSHSTSLPYEVTAASVGILICSQEFKLAIHTAIKSIPEGQASELIRQLTKDISESMEWMKIGCLTSDGNEFRKLDGRDHGMLGFHMQAELLGRVLSEIYTILLDSLTVTAGNCSLLGPSVKELVSTISPYISSMAGQHHDGFNEFLSSVMGRTSRIMADGIEKEKHEISSQWIFVFLFQFYVSCRSLYRQVISLTPPAASRKLSSAMGDTFTAYTGRDLMQKSDWTNEGYFSWIINPSPSLLDLIHYISNIYTEEKIEDCCPLIYVLHIMAFQRLVDLKRHRSSLQYLLQQSDKLILVKKVDDADLSMYSKKSRKLKRQISVLEQEAVELTDFMLGYIPLVANYHSIFSSADTSCEMKAGFQVHENDKWDFCISSLNKKSLPIALWWILCQNIDIWCSYTSAKKLKKKFKKFLMLLIQTSLPYSSNSSLEGENHKIDQDGQLKKITLYQISQGVLKDSTLYENKFVRRNLTSRFCYALENSVLRLLSDSSVRDISFKSFPVWPEVLSALDKTSTVISDRRGVKHDSATRSISNSSDRITSKFSMKQKDFPSGNVKFKHCQSLLNLLCWMPKGYLSSKTCSKLATYVLNLEQIVVANLLDCLDALSSYDCYELFQLFVACRRTLKNIIMASYEEKLETSLSSLPFVDDGSDFVTWLFKSVSAVIRLLDTILENCMPESKLKIFSLMDHTSHVLFVISKYQFGQAGHFIANSERYGKKQPYSGVVSDESILDEPGSEALRSLFNTSEILKEQADSALGHFKGALDNTKVGVDNKAVNINKMSFAVSCFGGFIWGLASALNQADEKSGELKSKFLRWKCEPLSMLNVQINVFLDSISDLLHVFLENNQQPRSYYDNQSFQKLDYTRDSLVLGDDLVEFNSLCKHLLQGLLKGDHPDQANLLRQLLITYSAIPRLNLCVDGSALSSGLVPLIIGISQVLLLELANLVEIPPPFTFVWLDGVVKYLEELGSHFSLTNTTLNGDAYAKLIQLHLRAIGTCISLQGKRATLESHERESSTKILHGGTCVMESFFSHDIHCLDEFRARLRMSFKAFIKNPSELQLLSAIQAVERALVGVHGHAIIYEINTGSANGGVVSSTVAAGIDCLDLILEYASGRKCFSVVKGHIQSLVAALFNIILHLQSPLIFYGNFVVNEVQRNPDAGSVVLMSIEVLTRISGKRALFQLDPWHIGQSLRVPGALFQDFRRLRLSEAPLSSSSLLLLDKESQDTISGMQYGAVDRQFSVNLFAACCRLLYTVLKHHKSECERFISVLEESVSILFHCLETVDADLVVQKGFFSWEIQEGVKCACLLRRIYEEIRQQKDVFAGHCYKFLSTYIWVYSGYGPLKTGIRREIDEALKPGIYALVDACSANDLQYLHAVFGEGPCRNTLASLQRDYKLNFQFEGKV